MVHDKSPDVSVQIGIGEQTNEPLDYKSCGESDPISTVILDHYFHHFNRVMVRLGQHLAKQSHQSQHAVHC